MSPQNAHPPGLGAPDPLLTPAEHEAIDAARKLKEASDRLIRRSAWLNRPTDFLHRFPQPTPSPAPPPDGGE